MNIKNLLKIKKQVQETDELLGDSNQASIAMANNYINAVENHIESYKNSIAQLPNKISKIPDNVLQDTIEYLVRNNINTCKYELKYILNLPTLIIHNEYNKYIQRTDKYINESNIFDLYLAITQDDIDIIMDNLVDRLIDFGCKIVRTESVDVEDDCDYEDYVDGHVCSYVFNIYIQNPTK